MEPAVAAAAATDYPEVLEPNFDPFRRSSLIVRENADPAPLLDIPVVEIEDPEENFSGSSPFSFPHPVNCRTIDDTAIDQTRFKNSKMAPDIPHEMVSDSTVTNFSITTAGPTPIQSPPTYDLAVNPHASPEAASARTPTNELAVNPALPHIAPARPPTGAIPKRFPAAGRALNELPLRYDIANVPIHQFAGH